MAAEFTKIIQIANQNAKQAREDDTYRAVSGSQLITGVNPRFTELTQNSQSVRISSGGDNNFQTGSNQSERAQVPPATINKVPRVYGKVTTGGVIVDAYKTDANTLTFPGGDTAGPSGGGFMSGLMSNMGGISNIVGLGTSLFGLGKATKTQRRRDELREQLFQSKMRGLNLTGIADEIASRRGLAKSGAQSVSGFGNLQRSGEGFLASLS